jgi:hypothetical protein
MTYLNTSILFFVLLIFGLFVFFKLYKNWTTFLTSTFGKVFKVLISLGLLTLILTGAIGAFLNFQNYLEKEKLRIFNEVSGIKLGITEDDLIFIKGKPKKTEKIESDTYLSFDDDLLVVTTKGKVIRIDIICSRLRYSYDFMFGGVSCGSSLETVVANFGEPDNISALSDKTSRVYNYLKYNIAFDLSKSSVNDIIIFDASEYKNGLRYFEDPPKPKKNEAPAGKFSQNSGKPDAKNNDHCAPNLSREERLRRLSLTGTIRETSYQTYSNGNHYVSFLSTGSEITSCR